MAKDVVRWFSVGRESGPLGIPQTILARNNLLNRRGLLLWNSEVRGFGVRVHSSGTKTFVFQYGLRSRRDRQAFALAQAGRCGGHPGHLRSVLS